MRIDVHAHYFPGDYVEKLIQLGRKDLAHTPGQSTDLSSRLAALDATHTDCQILSAVGLDTQVPDRAGAVEAARYINDVYKEVSDKHRGRFRAFGWVPLPFVDDAIAEAGRCLDQLGFSGICMPCFYASKPLDAPEFEPFWQEMDRRKAIIYVHPVGVHSSCHWGMADYGLHTAYGSPVQLSVAATRLVYSGVTTRYRNVRFIFAVCGGFLPYNWSRVERNLRRGFEQSATAAVGANYFNWVTKLPLDPKDPMSKFREFYYDTSTQESPEAMLMAKKSFGVDRLLLGSDEIFASLVEVVQYIEDSPYLTVAEKHAILDENAQKLFQFPHNH